MFYKRKSHSVVFSSLIAAGLLIPAGAVLAEDITQEGYWTGSESILRTGYGDCVHTIEWGADTAVAQCDPALVAARNKPEDMVAAEPMAIAPPRQVMNRLELQTDAFFEFDQAQLKPEGKAQLREIAERMRGKQDMSIQIKGHTDRIGAESYNLKLSEQRAMAVHDYLVELGIPESSLDAIALGESQPKAACEGIRGEALIECLGQNRRTEVEFSAFEVVTE